MSYHASHGGICCILRKLIAGSDAGCLRTSRNDDLRGQRESDPRDISLIELLTIKKVFSMGAL